MAFCVRSERKMEFQENKSSIPGPGFYIKVTPKKSKNDKQIFPPFHSSAERGPLIKIKDVPGPGSYNLDSNNNSLSLIEINTPNFQKNNNDEEENKMQDIVITNYNSNDKKTNNSFTTNAIGQNSSLTNSSKYNNISLKKGKNKNKSISNKEKNDNSNISDNNLTAFLNNFEGSILIPYCSNEKLGFLSQTTRFNKKKEIDNANTPGPGSYYESINSTLNESKLKSKIEQKNLKNASLFDKTGSLHRIVSIPSKIMNGYTYDNYKEDKNYVNNSQTKTFYKSNNSMESSKNSKKNILNNTFQSNSNSYMLINKDNNNNNNNNSNKELKLLINHASLKLDNKYSATNELVGPGSYNASLLEKNNNAINWSKGFNLKKINKKNDIKKRLKIIEEMKKKGDIKINNNNLYKKINKKIHKLLNPSLNQEQIKIKKTNVLKNKNNYSLRNSFIPNKSDIPGPGYYSNDLVKPENDILRKDEKKEENKENTTKEKKNKIPDINYRKFQCNKSKIIQSFGSHCERPFNKSKSSEDLGPTTYFRQKNKYEPEKGNTIYKKLILGKTQMSNTIRNNYDFYFPNGLKINDDIKKINSNIIKNQPKTNRNIKKIKYTSINFNPFTEKKSNSTDNKGKTFTNMSHTSFNQTRTKSFYSNPGPGTYELSHTFIKPSFSSNQIMGSKVERFSDSDDGNPGPGSYQDVEFGGKIILKNNCETKYKINRSEIDKEREKKIRTIIELNKKRNVVPGAGTYNVNEKNSIIYNVYSKLNYRQSFQSPFLNSSGRFMISPKDNEIISPTLYEPYKYEKEIKNNKFMAFNKSIRFNKEIEGNRHKDWFLAGPGSYDVEPEWNKKSYNVLFSGS